MRLHCTIEFEFDVPDDEERRAEAYPEGASDEAIIAAEQSYIEDDPGYMLGFDSEWTVTVAKSEKQQS